jgi:predicted hydrocarbon binding protein
MDTEFQWGFGIYSPICFGDAGIITGHLKKGGTGND